MKHYDVEAVRREIEVTPTILDLLCKNPKQWPKVDDGKVFVWEAVNLIGPAMFGEDWTGEELLALNWPIRPAVRVEQLKAGREKKFPEIIKLKAKAPPVLSRSGSGRGSYSRTTKPESINFLKNQNAHVSAWKNSKAPFSLKQLQSDWEENQLTIERLSEVAEWIGGRCRNAKIKSYYIMKGLTVPFDLEPTDWNCQNDLLDRIAAAGLKKFISAMSKRTFCYSFLNRDDLEREIKGLKHGGKAISTVDLAGLSPQLRFMVSKALQYGYTNGNPDKETREALQAQLIEDWAKERPGSTLDKTPAERMSFLMRHPPRK